MYISNNTTVTFVIIKENHFTSMVINYNNNYYKNAKNANTNNYNSNNNNINANNNANNTAVTFVIKTFLSQC